MTIHADAVTYAVREVQITSAETRVIHHFARGRIHRLTGDSRFGCVERGRLGFVNRIENVLHFVSWFTNDKRAADVRLVAFHNAAIVNENYAAFANDLGLQRTVGYADQAST